MSFLFDKIKIQVLGLFILTSASVTLKNFEKQISSIQDDVFLYHKTFLWARYKKKENQIGTTYKITKMMIPPSKIIPRTTATY